MRSKTVLFQLEEIPILLQYLYMHEDHNIVINNGLTNLRIRLDDNLDVWCQNLTFPQIPEMKWNENLCPEGCLDVIWMLRQVPATEFPERFANRWEEIKEITFANLALNKEWKT